MAGVTYFELALDILLGHHPASGMRFRQPSFSSGTRVHRGHFNRRIEHAPLSFGVGGLPRGQRWEVSTRSRPCRAGARHAEVTCC